MKIFAFGAAAPERLLSCLLGQPMPAPQAQIWRNKRPSIQELLRLPMGDAEQDRLRARISGTRWEPFTATQKARLQERYADDLFWLRAGADGLAHLLEDPKSEKTEFPAHMDFVNKFQRSCLPKQFNRRPANTRNLSIF